MTRFLFKATGGLVIAVLVGTAVALQVVRDQEFPSADLEEQVLYVTSGDLAKRLALSHHALVADTYWIRAIQEFGAGLRTETEKHFDQLFPLLDLTTSLDPYFTLAYRFGAIFLMEPMPAGAGRPDLAIKLLEKGIRQTPERWEYYLDIGFVYYWQLGDFARAAEWFQRGADLPDGPWWLRSYAAVMLARGGDREASRFLWQNFYETAENDWMRQNAERRLMQLDALDQIDQLTAIVEQYRARAGALPTSWADLVDAGALREVPVDPSGSAYLLDARSGVVGVARQSTLRPLPVEPQDRALENGGGALGDLERQDGRPGGMASPVADRARPASGPST